MFRKLSSLDEARRVIQEQCNPRSLGIEEVGLLEANGRVLAENVVARLNVPPFDRSTVDGYALKAEDTFGASEIKPVELKVSGTVSIGEKPNVAVTHRKVAEIVTGAPIPQGCNAIMMIENTHRKDKSVFVYTAAIEGENIMRAGSDVRKGESVLKQGQRLGSREVGVLAALGRARVKVHKVAKVAVFSTGAELASPGTMLSFGKIYDINAYSLTAAVSETGAEPLHLGVFPDNKLEIKRVLKNAMKKSDLVVTSGGVSVGPKDFMPQTLHSLGKPGVIVSGIRIKPGKPTTVALIDDKLVFSLPGHPASALLVYHLLVRPVILQMMGGRPEDTLDVEALASMRMFSAKGRTTFVMVKLERDDRNRFVAEPVSSGLSGAITTMTKADGYVQISEEQQFIDTGEKVTVHLFGCQLVVRY
jgi:putative molybdopterin biosynthesis protein